ncbi:MAG TPA: regulatory protein RecX [Acidothermaceae bacterium]|nr:regulatory protein RecX [Acidothermaceae bacterium]
MSGSFAGRRAARRPATEPPESSGQPVDPDDAPADPASVARTIALDLLTAAPRTRAQLAQAMARRGVPDDVANDVLERFGEVGLIDDAAFAQAWVTSRQRTKGLAPRALANELRQRGVDEPLIAEAVGNVDHDEIEATARTLVRRKARTMTGLPRDVKLRRLSGLLARKGYPSDVALRAVRDVLADEPDAATEALDLSDV